LALNFTFAGILKDTHVDYNIPFKGLKDGKHQYEFRIDDKFFEKFPESEIHKGVLTARVELIKRPTGIETFFDIQGIVTVPCDRCLDDMEYPVKYEGKLYFEFGEASEEVTDELVIISGGENYLELAQYIYEFINLSLPLQKMHGLNNEGESLCNQEMLARLGSILSNNDEDEIDDPRWDKLRDLIN
jgi:uncharacterized metal-binding protein YceD (DUF177 family)